VPSFCTRVYVGLKAAAAVDGDPKEGAEMTCPPKTGPVCW